MSRGRTNCMTESKATQEVHGLEICTNLGRTACVQFGFYKELIYWEQGDTMVGFITS